MAESNKQEGLCDNERFMDHLYRYGEIGIEIKAKTQQQNSAQIIEEIEQDRRKCALHRVTSINICLHKIKSLAPHSEEWSSYFNYIRWNHAQIMVELRSYLQHPCMEKDRETISVCSELLNYVLKEFCDFTVNDQSIISEYEHVFEMIVGRREPKKVLLQAGKLYVNFINILTLRYYYEETNRIKFDDVKMQADLLIDKLSSANLSHQANIVEDVYKNFVKRREMEAGLRAFQKDKLKAALKVTHTRATESVFQAVKRRIEYTISVIRQKLRKGLETVITVGSAISNPILHPIDTAKGIFSCIRHPIQSAKALIAWAKLNPYKCCALVIGGLFLGVVGFGATAILFDALVYDFTTRVLPVYLTGAVLGVFGAIANKANGLIQDANRDERNLMTSFDSFQSNLNATGENIVSCAMNDTNNEWWTLLDEFKAQTQADINQQIDTLNEDQLRLAEIRHTEYLPIIESQIDIASMAKQEATASMNHDGDDEVVLQRAERILRQRIDAANSFNWE